MSEEDKKDEKKTTSEKPVSLSPLKFFDALKGILGVKPKSVEDKSKEESGNESKGDKE